jgi:hypothetical protein
MASSTLKAPSRNFRNTSLPRSTFQMFKTFGKFGHEGYASRFAVVAAIIAGNLKYTYAKHLGAFQNITPFQ